MALTRLKSFVTAMTHIAESAISDEQWLSAASPELANLVSVDDWLPDAYAIPDKQYYRQYLLHCDPLERFSIVSFVWGPGQTTPIHDHTVWGLIGMLRGEEISTPYSVGKNGDLSVSGDPTRLIPGQVELLSPVIGDIHQVKNAFDDQVSISIHVYGANIGAVRRHVFDMSGNAKSFISGYSNQAVPNLWDQSVAA